MILCSVCTFTLHRSQYNPVQYSTAQHITVHVTDKMPLPKGAAQYMFPAGKQLPSLQGLTISPCVDCRMDLGTRDEWCLEGADIRNIAACCTGLRELDIAQSVRPGAYVCIAFIGMYVQVRWGCESSAGHAHSSQPEIFSSGSPWA
jgi:hypothetical protein